MTFPTDENAPAPLTTLSVSISVEDDEIDEAMQLFMVHFEVVNSVGVNASLINIDSHNAHPCLIHDNDSKAVINHIV